MSNPSPSSRRCRRSPRPAGPTAPIAIRVNPDVDARTHAKIATGKSENKFGVPISRARDVYARARALPGLSIRGVDMHIGSQITDLEPFDNAFALMADFVRVLRADGHTIDHVDLGGGLGIPYRTDNNPPPFPQAYADIVARHTRPLDCRLYLEPGRLIVGNAGVLVASVIFVKTGENKTFVIVDAAMNDLIRPTLYEAYHDILPVKEPRRAAPACSAPTWSAPSARAATYLALDRETAEGRPGRPDRGDDRGRLWRGAGGRVQFAPARPRGSGQGRRLRGRPAAAELRRHDRPRQTSALVGVRV